MLTSIIIQIQHRSIPIIKDFIFLPSPYYSLLQVYFTFWMMTMYITIQEKKKQLQFWVSGYLDLCVLCMPMVVSLYARVCVSLSIFVCMYICSCFCVCVCVCMRFLHFFTFEFLEKFSCIFNITWCNFLEHFFPFSERWNFILILSITKMHLLPLSSLISIKLYI